MGLGQDESIEWRSPLESEDFIEYRDHAFLERLGLSPQRRKLSDFWPAGADQYGTVSLERAPADLF